MILEPLTLKLKVTDIEFIRHTNFVEVVTNCIIDKKKFKVESVIEGINNAKFKYLLKLAESDGFNYTVTNNDNS